MSNRTRAQEYVDYYEDNDYIDVMSKLPDIIAKAEMRANEELEPTIHEKRKVMNDIKDFIRSKERKVYGGTALNEAILQVNPEDAIYDSHQFYDIEFYSPKPVQDLVDLCNLLYRKGYKHVTASEAQHEETYVVYVNFQQYCDITYMPSRVYSGVKVVNIDGIQYVHPHFILIDYLRIFNQPLTAAEQRWEKNFKRTFKLLRNYPIERQDRPIKLQDPGEEIRSYVSQIKKVFMADTAVHKTCLISGFDAYNFYILHAVDDRNVEQSTGVSKQAARVTVSSDKLSTTIIKTPWIELVSVDYKDTVERVYKFIKSIVKKPTHVVIEEYFPLFQFTGHSVHITYDGLPIAKIYSENGHCVPSVKTSRGYMYVSYQYLLQTFFIHKFLAHLEKNKEMYFNYSIIISNLVLARNGFLNKTTPDGKKLSVINTTVFGEFKIQCIGSTIGFRQESQLRMLKKRNEGKTTFRYTPDNFFNSTPDAQAKFDPTKYKFKNTSGNKITNPKNLLFKLSDEGDITYDSTAVESDDETEMETNDKITASSSN